jgi:hypothetical protein
MGTADERSWTSVLPELSRGQEAFARDLLERSGFHNVKVIAESPAFHREVKRLLFTAAWSHEAARRPAKGPNA